MNKVFLIGRLTAKPELRYTANNNGCTQFIIAVDRNRKNKDGNRECDFIKCVAWNQRAELLNKYCDKGSKISIEGRIQISSYENENGRQYSTDVVVESIEFLETKSKAQGTVKESKIDNKLFEEFGQQLEITDDDLPF